MDKKVNQRFPCFRFASKSKKGISAVVATVLIILITVAAVAIIWAAVIPMIRSQTEGGTACLAAAGALNIKSDFTCKTDNAIDVQVENSPSASGDFKLSKIKVIVHKTDGSSDFENFDNTGDGIPDTNEEKVLTWNETGIGAEAESISIAAIVMSGNQEKECDAGNEVTLVSCTP